jgi:hypothetical protein
MTVNAVVSGAGHAWLAPAPTEGVAGVPGVVVAAAVPDGVD